MPPIIFFHLHVSAAFNTPLKYCNCGGAEYYELQNTTTPVVQHNSQRKNLRVEKKTFIKVITPHVVSTGSVMPESLVIIFLTPRNTW